MSTGFAFKPLPSKILPENNTFNNENPDQFSRIILPDVAILFLVAWVLLSASGRSSAQSSRTPPSSVVYGQVKTPRGNTVVDATVEIRDLRGMRVGESVTDNAGRFKIRTSAGPGEYILLAAKQAQINGELIALNQTDLEIKIALPVASTVGGRGNSQYTISARQLSIPEEARSHLRSAHKDFTRMNLSGAAEEIDRALLIAPGFAQAFSMRALTKLAGRDPQGAVEDAARATFLDSNDAQSYIALVTAYNSLKEFEKASSAARQALALDPASWQARLEAAKSLYGQAQFVLALHELDLLNNDFPDVHLVRGNVLVRLDRPQEAASEFDIFMRQAPSDPRCGQIQRIVAATRQADWKMNSAQP